jgi:pimeloyl-ACP methyl ester carboxylesterase
MQLHYKQLGDSGPDLIILHGLLGSLDNWITIAKQLAGKYRVWLVDQRNHGKSPHSEDHSFRLMADDLKQLMDEHAISSAVLIGHSMGGKTAMQMAIDYPDKVEGLAVVDMAVNAYSSGHEEIFEALFAMDITNINSRKEADDMLAQYIDDVHIRQFLLKNLARDERGGFQWKVNLNGLWKNYSNMLAATSSAYPVQIPALFVKGGQSDYIRQDDEEQIRAIFPQARFEVVPSSGHWVHAEAPRPFLDHLSMFLNELKL